MVDEVIKQAVRRAASELRVELGEVELDHPAQAEYGDFSTNAVLRSGLPRLPLLYKRSSLLFPLVTGPSPSVPPLKAGPRPSPTAPPNKAGSLKPRELAAALVGELVKDKELARVVARVEAAGPGFINFWLKQEYLIGQVYQVIKQGEKYGRTGVGEGRKVMVEYTDPNPFKEFHIGHLYSNVVGESLARLAEANGYQVKRACYQGDVGMHVAKSVWGTRTKMKVEKISLENLQEMELRERVRFMGKGYALGAAAYEDGKKEAEEIKELNKLIFYIAQRRLAEEEGWQPVVDYGIKVDEASQEYQRVKRLYNLGRKWSLAYFEMIYRRLGTKFDYYYFESQVGEVGYRLVQAGLAKDIFQRSQEAVVYEPSEEEKLHTRVFINSLGLPTYEAKDLGLAPVKYEDFKYDRSIIVTGNEIDEYFRVILAALAELKPKLREKTIHLSHGMVRLPTGKMSSRTGKVVTGEELLAAVEAKAEEVMERGEMDLTEKEREKVVELVTVGAVKYALLRSGIGRDTVFEVGKLVSLEGNSGPYLQYTYARCRSVLAKADWSVGELNEIERYSLGGEEEAVVGYLYRYPEVVRQAGERYAPNLMAGYIFELAQRYNQLYNQCRIVDAPQRQARRMRLALTAATAQIIKNGLWVLGIEAPERM